jgi:hypothetical protein
VRISISVQGFEKAMVDTEAMALIWIDRIFALPQLLAFRLLAFLFVLFIRNVGLFLAPVTFVGVTVLVAVRGCICGYNVVKLSGATGREKH